MKKAIFLMLFLCAGSLILFALHKHSPEHVKWYPPCLFKKATGFDCPGCGGTRAVHNLLHGDVALAADHNLLLLLLLPLSVVGVGAAFIPTLKNTWQHLNKPRAILILVLFYWLTRNLPFFPFEWLHSDK